MDRNYLAFLRCLVSLGIYKAFGEADLCKYRTYYSSGMSPYSAVVQLFDDEHEYGVIPDEVLTAMGYLHNGLEPVNSQPRFIQLSLF